MTKQEIDTQLSKAQRVPQDGYQWMKGICEPVNVKELINKTKIERLEIQKRNLILHIEHLQFVIKSVIDDLPIDFRELMYKQISDSRKIIQDIANQENGN